jgi:hypothetical protein
VEKARGGDDGIGVAGRFPHGGEAIFVGLGIDEIERIGRAEISVVLFIDAVIEEHFQAFFGGELEVVAALDADLLGFVEFLLPDNLAAAVALLPQTFGLNATFFIRGRSYARGFPIPPGHIPLLSLI